MKFKKLPYGLVDLAISEGWERSLSYFLTISTKYGNSIIYDFTYRSLSVKLGLSKSALQKHVKFLVDKGLLIRDGRHLKCCPLVKLKSIAEESLGKTLGDGNVTIKVHDKIKHTEWNILARVPLKSLKQQKHNSRKREEVNALELKASSKVPLSKKEFKRYQRLKSNSALTEKSNTSGDVCYLSDSLLGKLMNGRSISNVRDMVKFWEEQGLLTFTLHKGRTLDTHLSRRAFEALRETREEFRRSYYFKGRAIQFDTRSLELGHNVTFAFKYKSDTSCLDVSSKTLKKVLNLKERLDAGKSIAGM